MLANFTTLPLRKICRSHSTETVYKLRDFHFVSLSIKKRVVKVMSLFTVKDSWREMRYVPEIKFLKTPYGKVKRNILTLSFRATIIVYNDLKRCPGQMLTFMIFYLPYQSAENSPSSINMLNLRFLESNPFYSFHNFPKSMTSGSNAPIWKPNIFQWDTVTSHLPTPWRMSETLN